VRAHQAQWPIRTQCRVLDVSTSGFYAWHQRQPWARDIADDELAEMMLGIYALSRETYGRPRIHAELREHGICISPKRVRRLMHEYELVGAHRRRSIVTTKRNKDARPAPDLVERKFSADAPNRLWVADISVLHQHRKRFIVS